MYVDANLELSDAQAVTSTAISANVIDLGPVTSNTLRDIGTGRRAYLVVITNTACTDSGSDATLAITLESDSTVDLATSATVHASSGTLAFATYATAGTVVWVVALPISKTYEQYLGVRYTVASGPLTAGKFDAFITFDVESFSAYARGYTIGSAA